MRTLEWLNNNFAKFEKICSDFFGGNENIKFDSKSKESGQFLINYFTEYVKVFGECPKINISRKDKNITKNYYSFEHCGEKYEGYKKIGVGKYEVFTNIYKENLYISIDGWTHKGNESNDKFIHILYHISKPFIGKWNRWESKKSYPWAVIK